MSSDGNDELTYKYPTGAIADSPIPLSQEHPINTPVHVHSPIPIIDFTTLQPLNAVAPTFVPRPVTASLSASDIAAMFRQLRVHTPTPLTPDGQRATDQANEMFTVSFTPAKGQGTNAGTSLEPGAVARPEMTLGASPTAPCISRAPFYDSATNNNLRHCTRCGEQSQYCHGHTPIVPNPTLNLPLAQP
jgi:hypothetical protein